jgi:malonyl-CoA O-methyltransferase
MGYRLAMLECAGIGLNNSWGKIGMVDKQKVARSFGQAASSYHDNAILQQNCAQQLLEILEPWVLDLPDGDVLEVGCGTGFLTQGLGDRFPDRSILATDIAAEMVQFSQSCLAPYDQISFQQMDGERITGKYALIVSNFVIQWFAQPEVTLRCWLEHLEPNGLIALAFPAAGSFPEWQDLCDRLQIPFTANDLPDAQALIKALSAEAKILYCEEIMLTTTHRNASDFLRGLKAIGAGVTTSGKALSLAQMKKLVQTWDNRLKPSEACVVHYHVAFWVIQRHVQ